MILLLCGIQKNQKTNLGTQRTHWWFPGERRGGMTAKMGEVVKRHKLPTVRKVGPGHVMHSTVTRVGNTVLYT